MARTQVNILGNTLKNYIINGAFDYWQRSATFSAVGNTSYCADRWWANNNGTATIAVSRQDITSLGMGVSYAARAGRTAGTNSFGICTNLETAVLRELKGKYITASVWLRKGAGLTTDVTVSLFTTASETRGTASVDLASTVALNSSLNTSTFTKVKVTLFIPASTSALGLQLSVIAGSSAGSGTNYFEVTKVMLNEGQEDAPFERAGRDLTAELMLCQRYYEKSYSIEANPGTASTENGTARWLASATSVLQGNVYYKTQKRASPSVFIWATNGTSNSVSATASIGNIGTVSGVPANHMNEHTFGRVEMTAAVLGAGSMYQFHWAADAEL